jgi:hypothetical protein
MTFDGFLLRFDQRKPIAGGFQVRCPGHPDDTASLSVTEGRDGKILLHCHANCETASIVSAMGLTMTDLFPPRDRDGLGEPIAVYDYRDEHGELVSQALRFPAKEDGKKTFLQRRPSPGGGWIWKMEGARRLCYHLDKLQGKTAVMIVEGEKDADRLWGLGLPATTNAAGAGKWKNEHTQQLVAAGITRVVVIEDNDPPGAAHGMQVSRDCADAGLFVRRIQLPGLPEHGDVSDWLDAGHTKDDLLGVIKSAPPFQAQASVVLKPKLELTSLADLLAEPDDAIEWLVDERIPGGSLVLLAGKPKAGKSVLARCLAYAVAAGEPWLGHHVVMGPVWLLAFEDKRSEVRAHFRRLGATGTEPLFVLVGQAPERCMALLQERATQEKPVLIIIDTLQRLIEAKDMSDYAEVTTKLSPVLKLCRDTGAACVLVHHANKYGEGLDCILGSTALSGSVDNIFIMGRGEHERTLQSIQRIGEDLAPTVVAMDEYGQVSLAGSKHDADMQRTADLILAALRGEAETQTERWLREQVEAAPKAQAQALRMMLRRGWIYRLGEGKRGNPYTYGCASTIPEETRKTRNDTPKPGKPEYVVANTGVNCHNEAERDPLSGQVGQNAPCKKPEKHTKPESPSTRTSTGTDRDVITSKVVSLVSKSGGNGNGNGNGRNGTRVSASTYSGFATSEAAEEVDDSMFANQDDEEAV